MDAHDLQVIADRQAADPVFRQHDPQPARWRKPVTQHTGLNDRAKQDDKGQKDKNAHPFIGITDPHELPDTIRLLFLDHYTTRMEKRPSSRRRMWIFTALR